MKLNQVLAKRIEKFLVERNWSTYRLSRKTGLTVQTIQMILSCKHNDVMLSSLIAIAHAFDMSVSQLLDDASFDYDNLEFDKL